MNLTVFAEQQGSTAQMLMTFLPLVLILAVFYFIIIKPQRKQEMIRTVSTSGPSAAL